MRGAGVVVVKRATGSGIIGGLLREPVTGVVAAVMLVRYAIPVVRQGLDFSRPTPIFALGLTPRRGVSRYGGLSLEELAQLPESRPVARRTLSPKERRAKEHARIHTKLEAEGYRVVVHNTFDANEISLAPDGSSSNITLIALQEGKMCVVAEFYLSKEIDPLSYIFVIQNPHNQALVSQIMLGKISPAAAFKKMEKEPPAGDPYEIHGPEKFCILAPGFPFKYTSHCECLVDERVQSMLREHGLLASEKVRQR
jgi:hypothetical protein